MATNTMAPIQVQAVGRKDGELPCTISLPSIRMGLAAEGDKAAALEQWGSLAALKPELFVNAHLRNPGTPASNADTPKAASSPPLPSGVEDEAPALDAKERVPVPVVAAVKDADSTVKDVPTRGEPMQTPVEFEAVAAHFAAVMASESSYAVQVDRSTELTCREEAERRESEDRDAARKRKAEEMGLGELGEDELLAAEILSGSFLTGITHQRMPSPRAASGGKGRGSGGNRDENRVAGGAREGKRARQASAKAAAAALLDMPLRGGKGVGSRSRAGTGPKSVQGNKSSLPKGSANCAVVTKGKVSGAGKGAPGASGLDESAGMSAAWVKKVVGFLESNGQDLLSSICAHYRIDFCGDVSSIRDYSLEQLAHNAIFNPALPKASGRLPKMLRDIPGVTNWHMTFLKDQAGIFRAVRVATRLGSESLTVQCRCCSYCGSCFSGRFMKPNAMHQQAGGWKEITERTAAGKYSWSTLRGWRLCVPCFTHWASNGTNVNANRPSVEDLMQEHKDLLACEMVSDEALDPKSLGLVNVPVAGGSWQHQSAMRSANAMATTS